MKVHLRQIGGFLSFFSLLAFVQESPAVGGFDSELHPLYRGARATAMGGAFVAIADDEQAIFLNPAGLAGQTGFNLNYGNVDVEAGPELYTSLPEVTAAFASASASSLNAFVGKHYYGRFQATPNIMMPNIAVSGLVSGEAALYARNLILPEYMIGFQQTNGVQAAVALSVIPSGRKKNRHDLRVGLAGKMMLRKGGYKSVSFTDLLKIVDQKTAFFENLAGDYQLGYSFDLGLQYVFKANKMFTLMAGLAWLDMGDMVFGGAADTQKQNLSLGIGSLLDFGFAKIRLAYDYRNITDDRSDYMKKNHVGMELKIPFVSAQVGLYQSYLSYGVGVDVWLVSVQGTIYQEDLGTVSRDDKVLRYLARVALKLSL